MVNNLPVNPLSPEEQQKLLGQMHLLMEKQVKSYHRHHRMGSNTSIPQELARELLESLEYTLDLAGGMGGDVEKTLRQGQEILAYRLEQAKKLLSLVYATAPDWQTECRWEALRYLGQYLDSYDHLHLAHKGPEELFYPILIAPPEGIRGIDSCLFYLHILWIENQILAGLPEGAPEALWDRLPTGTLNQCEQVLLNGLGKALINGGLESLVFRQEEYFRLLPILMGAEEADLHAAVQRLCQWLKLEDQNARDYVLGAVPQLLMWIREGITGENLMNILL